MDDAEDRSPVEALCDVFVYAPLGFALEAPKLLPELAAKGRNQVAAARTVGRYVVSQAAGGLVPLAGSMVSGVLRGLSGTRRSTSSSAPSGQPAPSAPLDTPPDLDGLDGLDDLDLFDELDDLDEVAVVPEVDVAAVEPDALAEAGLAELEDASTDGQLDRARPPTRRRTSRRLRNSPSGRSSSTGSAADEGTTAAPGASTAEPADETVPGDGLAGAPVSDVEVGEPELDAPRPTETPDTSGADPEPAAPAAPAVPAGASNLAIPEYDSLAASQVVPRLGALSREELSAVRTYEAAHRGRRTILGRADQLLGRSSGSGA